MSAGAVEVTSLYAVVCVRDIHQIVPASQAVAAFVAPIT
jgi:hypothetical protein